MTLGRILSAIILTTMFSIPLANAQDPCGEVIGAWQGQLSQSITACKWDAIVQGSQYKDIYRLQIKLRNGTYPAGRCIDNEIILTGACKDAKLSFVGFGTQFKGTVFGGVMGLDNGDVFITLAKA